VKRGRFASGESAAYSLPEERSAMTLAQPLRTLAAALLLAGLGTSSALAQSSVTLSGIIDAGVTRVSGLKGGSISALSSGIMDGSRVIVRANEDLGGGWRALMTLEHRLELDTGLSTNRPPSANQLPDRLSQASLLGLPGAFQPVVTAVANNIGSGVGVNLGGAFWDRQAFVGLVTPVGAFLAGRQYTPGFEISATFDAFGTQSAASAGQVGSLPAAIDIRLSNTLAWRAEIGGFVAAAMVGAGEGSSTAGRFTGAMAQYRAASWSVGVALNRRDNERGQASLQSLVAGASVALGPGRVYAMLTDVQDDNPSGVGGIAALVTPSVGPTNAALIQNAFTQALKQDARLIHLGYRATFGMHTVYAGTTQYDDQRAANADTRSVGAAYSYALSKRTDINLAVARFTNAALAQAAPGGGGYLGGVTASAGTDATSLALGLRHRF
jgi:predicted porin